ncbi:uncharacterized protein LOC103281785 isoform X1 [Anolis carolinensis]|uniref:uncharacterized protein LOC103281785 isoform X1 n=1 Tax=Anolis carolinensis TaxID=28377 RepID=UPI0004625244|nr:PREDICTED: formin-like protein 16 [Anolis carolinensis]|eukprot:XP_008122184.1 PREDICTED: formin-like protein 16 [Anolis carolinensis]
MGPFPLVAAAAAVAEGARHTSALSPFLPLLPFFRRRDGAPQSEVPPEELPLPPPPRHGSPPRARPAPPRLCRMGPPLPPGPPPDLPALALLGAQRGGPAHCLPSPPPPQAPPLEPPMRASWALQSGSGRKTEGPRNTAVVVDE